MQDILSRNKKRAHTYIPIANYINMLLLIYSIRHELKYFARCEILTLLFLIECAKPSRPHLPECRKDKGTKQKKQGLVPVL